jgi:ribosomal protein S18 acetylase RimI-like enzyme
MLSVQPAAMDQRLGRTLLEASEAYAREHGLRRIEMSVVGIRETLIAWYERRGYRRTGESIPFPYENKSLGRPNFPNLAFEILEKYL